MTLRRPSRLSSFQYRGRYRYFVTCCTFQRRRLFVSRDIVSSLKVQVFHACGFAQFALLALVFMPDHLHLLVEGLSDDADFRRLMRVVRQRTTVEYRRFARGVLWQDGYFERVLRCTEQTGRVIKYILANPVRAGLIENAIDYPFGWAVDVDPD